MSDLTGARTMIQTEEVAAQAAVSEATMTRVGQAINFINTKQYMKFTFGVEKVQNVAGGSPTYNIITVPYTDFGQAESFPYNAEMIGAVIRHGTAGSGGTSEIDIKWAPAGSASYNSIFSTTPKVASTAASDVEFDTFGNVTPTPTGCTVPVLSKTSFAAGDKLRCDFLQAMTGSPNGFVVDLFFRPR